MRFGKPEFLWLLFAVPVMAAAAFWSARRLARAWAKAIDPQVRTSTFVERGGRRVGFIHVLWLFAFALALLALAQPQYGASTVKQNRRGLDLVVALDVSKSMLARDLQPDRLSRAKLELQALLDQLSGDRVGIIAFAGDAFVQCPLTSDYNAAKVFLRALDTNTIPKGGTAIGAALKSADQLFDEARTRGGSKSQILLLLTDGEDHDEGALPAAKALAEKGVVVYTVGIGSTAGEPIPLIDDKGRFTGYLKDRQGGTVLTRLNEDILKQIADAGHGRYVPSQGGTTGIDQLMPDLASFEREEREAKFKVVYADRFQWTLVPALLLFALAAFLPRRRRVPLFALALLFVAGRAEAIPLLSAKNSDIEAGNKLLDKNKPDDAIKAYETAKAEVGDRPELFIDQGMALAQKGDHKGARPMFERALMSPDAKLRGHSHYLMGNGAFDEKDYQGAIAEYKKALREDASNLSAKYNLELSQKLLKEQQEQQKKEQDKQDKKDQKKDQKKDDKKKDQDKDQKQKDQDQKKQDEQKKDQDQQKPDQEKQQQQPQAQPAEKQDSKEKDKEQQQKQLLDALQAEEKPLRFDIFKNPKQRKHEAVEKDW